MQRTNTLKRKTPLKKQSVKASTIRNRCDKLARERCVSHGCCEAAGEDGVKCSGRLEWAHLVSRRYMALRHDRRNCMCLCWSHHYLYTNRPDLWVKFIDRKHPGLWDTLHRVLQENIKIDTAFYRKVLARFEEPEQLRGAGMEE